MVTSVLVAIQISGRPPGVRAALNELNKPPEVRVQTSGRARSTVSTDRRH